SPPRRSGARPGSSTRSTGSGSSRRSRTSSSRSFRPSWADQAFSVYNRQLTRIGGSDSIVAAAESRVGSCGSVVEAAHGEVEGGAGQAGGLVAGGEHGDVGHLVQAHQPAGVGAGGQELLPR